METFLSSFSETPQILSYFFVVLLTFIQGEFLVLIATVFTHNSYFTVLELIILGALTSIIHNYFYWKLGMKLTGLEKKRFFFINLEKVGGFLEKIKNREAVYIFTSRFSFGFHKFILLAVGYMRIPFKKLLKFIIPTAIFWSLLYVGFGYFFAYKIDIIRQDLKTVLISVTVFLIVILIFEDMLKKILRKNLEN